ncbi:hypothetical protein L0P54_04230 [Anaerosalibacter bizertensis]|uniref:Uncharacterized protein n=1 Tax=Anaerosalibacter bizertensis TaxID=932217 RepID=A0A9Q4ABF7_9FIRM|nr:hypothetical protein [Anaerosalibacter bizertensis]MBV1817050.1 hypothetical protein [Bacteroidales bacterium MSK.15.36]MCB5560292.1 hypothetical protein [Anaerosalibacter bizertensis]MCG4564814.1 hypothetical protein [Anaerosalibacter bizertensis]MCG4582184.1 hypothetical protein [Anaerosalibacter bizertensis]MCG4585379.1 hypothetical protein [Anaerosalibacter bizertensis]
MNNIKRGKLNDHLLKLKKRYFDVLRDNKKSPNELCNYIKSKFDVKDISKDDNFLLGEKQRIKSNCLFSYKNKEKSLKKEDMILNSYIILRNFKSEKYYSYMEKIDWPIYVVVEMNTGYVESNCEILNDELYLYLGISQFDISNNTPDLALYLMILDEINDFKNI